MRRSLLANLLALALALVGASAPLTASALGDAATTFRIDAGHSGAQPSDVLRPPLTRRWSVDLGGPVYFPLIVGGTVYVVAGNMPGPVYPNYGSQLYALNLADGHVIWGPKAVDPWGGGYFSGLTYDAGRLFVVTASGVVDAIDPSTGAYLWPKPVAVDGIGVNAQPTAVNGVVYVTAAGNQYAPPTFNPSDANVSALRESDGQLLWVAGIDSGDFSAPVVSSTGVYVTNDCEDTWDFNPTTGALLWHYQTGCFGGGGTTPALWQGQLFVRDTANAPGTILDAASGLAVGHFPSRLLPAFNGRTAFLIDQNSIYPGLMAWDIDLRTPVWTLAPPAGDWFNNAPIFSNGVAYTSTHNGLVIAANALDGREIWSDNLGVAIVGTNNMALAAETSGISVGDGSLLLPVNTELVAYGNGGHALRVAAPSSSAAPFRVRTSELTSATPERPSGPLATPAPAATIATPTRSPAGADTGVLERVVLPVTMTLIALSWI